MRGALVDIAQLTEADVGKQVVFKGFDRRMYTYWKFVPGKTYKIVSHVYPVTGELWVGIADGEGDILPDNYGDVFNFEWRK